MKKIKYEKGDLTEWKCMEPHPTNGMTCSLPWKHSGDHMKSSVEEVVTWRQNEYNTMDV